MDLKSYQRIVRWTMQGLTEPFLKISLAVTEAKSREVCTVLVDKWLFLKNWTTLPKKRSVGPLSRWKLSIWTIALSCSAGQILVNKVWLPTTDSSYKVTYFFWLCVRTRCLSICAPSFVAVVWCKWAPRVIVLWVWKTPPTVSRNLNLCVL